MSYYFQQINLPNLPPFEDADNRWPTCVGKFIKPIVDARPGLKYWFSYYGDHFQLCFLTDDYAAIRADMDLRIGPLGLTWRREPEAADTLEGL